MLGTLQQREILNHLNNLKSVYIVGGAVRDHLLGTPAKDLDVVIDLPLAQVREALLEKNYIPHQIGALYQTVSIFIDGNRLDITSLKDGDIREDALRRDFSINAIYVDFSTETYIDPLGGREDLIDHYLRACSTPTECFQNDPVRVLRMVRIATQFQLKIDQELWDEGVRQLLLLQNAALERVSDELTKILILPQVGTGIELLDELGYWKAYIPELARLKGLKQNQYHSMDAWDHTKNVVCNTPANLLIRIAALFHDLGKWDTASKECSLRGKICRQEQQYRLGEYWLIGKNLQRWNQTFVAIRGAKLDHHPDTVQVKTIQATNPCEDHFDWTVNGKRHFLGHERESAVLARNILKRYCFSMFLPSQGLRGETEIVALIANHMAGTLNFMDDLKGKGNPEHFTNRARKFIWSYSWTGRDFMPIRLENLLELWRADYFGGKVHGSEDIERFETVMHGIHSEIQHLTRIWLELQWEPFSVFAAEKEISGERYGRFKIYVLEKLMLSKRAIKLSSDFLDKMYQEFNHLNKAGLGHPH